MGLQLPGFDQRSGENAMASQSGYGTGAEDLAAGGQNIAFAEELRPSGF